MTPERLAAYRKTFGPMMSTEELRAIVEGRKLHNLSEEAVEAIRLLLAERKGGGHQDGSPLKSRDALPPQRSDSRRVREVAFKQLPKHVLSVREFFTCYKDQWAAEKPRSIFLRHPTFQVAPDFSQEVKQRILNLLSGSPSLPVAYYAKKRFLSGKVELLFLEDSLIIDGPEVATAESCLQRRQGRLRIELRAVQTVEMRIIGAQFSPLGSLLLDGHLIPCPMAFAHLFAQLVVRLSSASYNIARFAETRKARARDQWAETNLFRKWLDPLSKVLPAKSKVKVGLGHSGILSKGTIGFDHFDFTGFAGIPWHNIADVHTYVETDVLQATTSAMDGVFGGVNENGRLTVLTVEGETMVFLARPKSIPLVEECIKELVGIGDNARSVGTATPTSPQSLIDAGKSKSRAVGFSMIALGIVALCIGALGGVERFGYGPFAVGFFALLFGIWRMIRP